MGEKNMGEKRKPWGREARRIKDQVAELPLESEIAERIEKKSGDMTIAKITPEKPIKFEVSESEKGETETNGQREKPRLQKAGEPTVSKSSEKGPEKNTNKKIHKVGKPGEFSHSEELIKMGFQPEDYAEMEKVEKDKQTFYRFYKTDKFGTRIELMKEKMAGAKKVSEKEPTTEKISKENFEKEFGHLIGKNFYKQNTDEWMYIKDFADGKATVFFGQGKWPGKAERIAPSKLNKYIEIYKIPEKSAEEVKREKRSQTMTEYTLHRVKKYDELNAKTEKERDEKFTEKSREFWRRFATHGYYKIEKGQAKLVEKGDLDGKAFLKLMELAGMDIADTKYLKPEDKHRKGAITGDMTKKHGVFLEDGGESLIINDEGKDSKRGDSTAKFTYEILVDLGLLKPEKYLEEFVKFVTLEDNKDYGKEELKELFDPKTHKYAKTIVGLHSYMDIETILELFKHGKQYDDKLTDEELDKYKKKDFRKGEAETLKEASKTVENKMDQSRAAIGRMRWEGFEIKSDKYGKVLVDIGNLKISEGDEKILNRVSLGSEAYWAMGGGAYVVYIREHNRFKVFTEKKMEFEFGCGFPVRGHFWNKPANNPGMVPLEEILTKICGKEMKIGGELKKAIEKEEKKREGLRSLVEETNKITEDLLAFLDSSKFNKEMFLEKTISDARTLREAAEGLKNAGVGKGKEYANWEKKKAEAGKLEKKVEIFLKKIESKKESLLTEIEKKYAEEVYVDFAKSYLDEIRNYYSEDKGYSEADILNMVKTETDRFWKTVISEEIEEDGKIKKEHIGKAIELIKRAVEK